MKNKYFRMALFFIFFTIIYFIVISLPVFTIKQVTLLNNGSNSESDNKITEAYFRQISGLDQNTNIFAFNSSRVKKKLLEDPYVDSVTIRKRFPDSIVVTVVERKIRGYVEWLKDTYLYIDKDGRILEVSNSFVEQHPVAVGLSFDEFDIGKILKVDNPYTFDIVVELSNLFTKYEMSQSVIRVDVTKYNNIHLFVYNIDVSFGTMEDADDKIRTLKEVIKNIQDYETVRGLLNIENIQLGAIFKPLK